MRRALTIAAAVVAASTTLAARAQPAPAQEEQRVALPVASVPANLNITPKRVTFDGSRRSATVFIFNQGGSPATFDITLIDRVMTPEGQIVAGEQAAKVPAQKAILDKVRSAKDMVQIAPRRVSLAPGKGQTIRIRVGNIPQDPAAEYRTHLTVTTIPPRNVGVTAEDAARAGPPNQLSFRINTVYGVSIPLIIRPTAPDARASLQNAHVETHAISVDGKSEPKPTPILVVDLVRTGANSLYGNVEIRTGGKRGEVLGSARGVGVYTEIDGRTIRVPLNRAPKAGEKLEVTFTDDDTSPGKVLATSVL